MGSLVGSLVGSGRLKLTVSFGKASKARRGNAFLQFFYEAESARERGDVAFKAVIKFSCMKSCLTAFDNRIFKFGNCLGIYIRDSMRVWKFV